MPALPGVRAGLWGSDAVQAYGQHCLPKVPGGLLLGGEELRSAVPALPAGVQRGRGDDPRLQPSVGHTVHGYVPRWRAWLAVSEKAGERGLGGSARVASEGREMTFVGVRVAAGELCVERYRGRLNPAGPVSRLPLTHDNPGSWGVQSS